MVLEYSRNYRCFNYLSELDDWYGHFVNSMRNCHHLSELVGLPDWSIGKKHVIYLSELDSQTGQFVKMCAHHISFWTCRNRLYKLKVDCIFSLASLQF